MLSNVTAGWNIPMQTANVSILDNDIESAKPGSGSLKFAKTEYHVTQGYPLNVTVMRVGGARGVLSVNYTTEGNTANAGTDFKPMSGTLTFQPGENAKILTIQTLRSGGNTNGKLLNFTLSNPNPVVELLSPSVASVFIDQ
jgi:hypothetical protein